jgi:hypothetical protein
VTLCDFRHVISCARRAFLVAPPFDDDEVFDVEVDAVVLLVELFELLALPQAAIRQPAARVTTATAIRFDPI